MDLWLTFYRPDGKELASYTANGTFRGEMQATKALLAAENGISQEEITVKCERRRGRGNQAR